MNNGYHLSAFAATRNKRRHGEDPANGLPPLDGLSDGLDEEVHIEETTGRREEEDAAPTEQTEPTAGVGDMYLDDTLSTWPCAAADVGPASESSIQLRLAAHQTLCLIGSYELAVVSGTVTVAGAVLDASTGPVAVAAPSSHPLPVIECRSVEAELALQSCHQAMRRLEEIYPLYGRIWEHGSTITQHHDVFRDRSFTYLQRATADPLQRRLTVQRSPQSWEEAMAEWTSAGAQTGAILTVCGAEAAGKSTFAKLLANRLLSTSTTADESAKPRAGRRPGSAERLVYWLDLDPAHTEFCQPGEIALVQLRRPILGPNYTLRFSDPPVYKIVRSHAIGTLSPNDSFQRYSACAQNLVDEIRRLLRASSDPVCVVLVWCDLVSAPAIALLGQLTDVGLPSRMYHVGEILPGLSDRLAESGILERLNVKEAEALPSLFPSRTAAERRTMQSISYFHRQQEGDGPISTLLTPLSWVKPWIVSYSESCSDRIRFVSTGDLQPRSLLPTVINGAVVGISLSTYYSSHHHSGHHRSRDNSQGPVPGEPDNLATDLTHLPVEAESASNLLSPDWSENVGFGIVRGVDSKNECIHLLTPVDLASFIEPAGADGSIGSTGTTIVLVLGSIEYPGWAYMGDVHMRQIEDAAMQAGKASLAGDRGTKSVCQTGPWMSKVDDDGGLGIGGVKKRVRRM